VGGLDQQEAQEGRALFGEVAQPLVCSAAVFGGDQADVAGHLCGGGEALDWAQDEHGGQSGDGADAGLMFELEQDIYRTTWLCKEKGC
jgi:hypothetical protein